MEPLHPIVYVASMGALIGALAGWLPPVAALMTIMVCVLQATVLLKKIFSK
jgi:hypothetical protein